MVRSGLIVRRMRARRPLLVGAVVTALLVPGVAQARADGDLIDVNTEALTDLLGLTGDTSPALCGADDLPETGIQGDVPMADQVSGRADLGYNCGLALVGYEPIGGRGNNANMAWVDHCAYIAGDGIAVIDASDPANPRHVQTLHGPGSTDTLETLHAVRHGDRAVLVAGRYSLFVDPEGVGPVDIYDASDCTQPQLQSTIEFPSGVHNLTLSPDATTIWSTLPVQAADITDLRQPRYLGNLDDALRAQGVFRLEYAHEVWTSPDGNLLYLGGQIVGDERPVVVDVSSWPAGPPQVIGDFAGSGHSIRTASMQGGRQYLLHSDESVINPTANGCLPSLLTPFGGVAEAMLTDVTDLGTPRTVGHLGLAINEVVHCLDQLLSGVNASSHYHDVDDPDDTTFAMVSMWNAGLRIFDVRDPAAPVEVAYFNPGRFGAPAGEAPTPFDALLGLSARNQLDQAWAHVRYLPETGHLWLTTRTGGFWVLELEPQVRAALGLPAIEARWPDGAPPRPDASRISASVASAAALYCTLDALA